MARRFIRHGEYEMFLNDWLIDRGATGTAATSSGEPVAGDERCFLWNLCRPLASRSAASGSAPLSTPWIKGGRGRSPLTAAANLRRRATDGSSAFDGFVEKNRLGARELPPPRVFHAAGAARHTPAAMLTTCRSD